MDVGMICTRDPVTCSPDDTLIEAATLMREHHVGDLIVVDSDGEGLVPVGLITDRDIVVGVIANGSAHLAELLVGDVITGELVSCSEEETPHDALQLMLSAGVRRLPVVDAVGDLVGVVALDDIVSLLARELARVATLIEGQREDEALIRAS